MGISSQNTLLNNSSLVQPILTCNIPINSARQAKTYGNIKNSPNFILGEQWGNFQKNTTLNNFLTVQPIFASNIPIDTAEQEEQN